ncbi:sensor domain-containing diguanylate cyclase [Desulfuromonas acetoxidans]|uniref:Diguanylate cyclase with PAS/PAC sensor n=1 Tax=Desulfuromonas acetoxidans (strain DSM 684 / 11070) TaxID=281689 RepID=Q1K397_DESA6|nr:sensor domain-containing diguanylate cyclase [Desulfuromonas acetoxidans]EAT17077.1 diguanylate cyclase with PAS/PAC sensor [Desulfuromonas acetoxidans DSM 684]MBF0645112.1 sensor domain-containing diguanylate cyclase [Desulfuromonas acetoxidans]NVD24084.1 sensor domain-containing diguanylate cyclase [Desulfuromonas acetoxidans]NVE16380.1 sensor domain-containing diguanylate cyclase [Desulfuromonas acetoxidans]
MCSLDEKNFRTILNELYDGLYFVDHTRTITFWNKAAERITGFTAEEVIGSCCGDDILTHVDDTGNNLCLGHCPLAATITDQSPRAAQVYLHHKQGHRVPVSVRISVLTDETGAVIGAAELFSDISDHRANELRVKELEQLALVDKLTQLANRRYIESQLEKHLTEFRRTQLPFAVYFFDIDHFKQINDTYGHDAGDTVLKFLAKTLIDNGRAFDIYGRWGGEEFIAIIRNLDGENLLTFGERLRMLVEQSYLKWGEHRLAVTVSLGGTLAQNDDTLDSLIKRADRLLYTSKKNGRNRLTIG